MRAKIFVLALAPFIVLLSATAALADTWVLLLQPAPYSDNPPPYSSWQAYQQFDSLDACFDQAMSMHYQYWDSDRDLSMRALSGVCRDEATGRIATGPDDAQ